MIVRESLIVEKQKLELSAGLVIIQDDTILLAHPKDSKWWGTYSIPKGLVEEGEDLLEAAIRETYEEVGISISKDEIETKEPQFIDYTDKSGNVFKRVYYFVAVPDEHIDPESITPDKTEIDWAGFITREKASQRMFWRLKPILNLLPDTK